MLKVSSTLVWMTERIVETSLGAIIARVVLGPNSNGATWPRDVHTNLYLVLFFMACSGYLLTTLVAEFLGWKTSLLRRGWVNIGLFFLHSAVFLLLFVHADLPKTSLLVVLGTCSVAFAAIVGETALRGLRAPGRTPP